MTKLNESRKEVQFLKPSSILTAKKLTKFGTWNVRTLYQCGKLSQLLKEFDNYQMDILGISEMRWTGSGKLCSDGKTILYSGHEHQHARGVGIVLNKEATNALIGWKPVNERIITARFYSKHTKTTVIQVYAPTEESDEAEKDAFYDQLQDTLDDAPSHDIKLLIGDMNAQIDKIRQGFEHVIGPHGSAIRTNDNGDRLLCFCSTNDLCIGNTYFAHKNIHKKTWRSPDGITNNEIDFVCISKRWRSALQDVRVYRGADVGSDHRLIRASLKLRLKRKTERTWTRPYAVEKLKDHHIAKQYQSQIQNKLQQTDDTNNVEQQWTRFKQAVVDSAEETIGRRRGSQRERWIQIRTWDLIDQRKIVMIKRDQAKTEEEQKKAGSEYLILDRQVKKSCRADKKDWLDRKGTEAQEAANRNDTKTLYHIVKELTGARCNSNIPIKDKNGRTLLSKEEQDNRWVEHFTETLNQPNPIETFNINVSDFTDDIEVNMDMITTSETSKAINLLKNNKAAGMDQIPAELIKHGGPDLIKTLTNLLNNCWQSETVPEEWRKGMIVKIPKKGNVTDCNNWRGITLLSIPGKVFCTVLLRRIKEAINKLIREEQAGFRAGRSCSEQIFTLRNIIEQSVEFQRPLSINFVDFKKAFDSVHRESLWTIARVYGIPPRYINIFRNIYLNSSCCVKTKTGITEFFPIITGVRQGCVLSPFLFLLVVDFIMRKTMDKPNLGIWWNEEKRLTDLDFADDIALLAETRECLQTMTSNLNEAAKKVGLRINCEKTHVMQIGKTENPQATTKLVVGNQTIEDVLQFTYLGSILTKDGGAEEDVNCRIGKALGVFQRLRQVWSTKAVGIKLKIRLYNSIVVPTAIYASETWKTTARIDQKLNVFQQRCLRRILGISYRDHITNEEVLRRSDLRRLQDIVTERRMRLAGHTLRLPDHRHPKIAIQWVPYGGKRNKGRPKKTWRTTFKQDLQNVKIKWDEAENIAQDRHKWKKLAAQCAQMHRRN